MINTEKFATFEPREAQYVRLTVLDSYQNKNFVIIGDINIYAVDTIPSSVNKGGRWNITLNFPLVPVTAFLNPKTQDLITMSADQEDHFQIGPRLTISATWYPKKGTIVEQTIDATGHDMFCPGTSFNESGGVLFTGGSSPLAFSIYDPVANSWSTPEDKTTHKPMTVKIGRGYQGQTFLPNGKTFMIGGRFSGDNAFDRDGELYDPATGWTVLRNVKADTINMDISRSCKPPRNDNGVPWTDGDNITRGCLRGRMTAYSMLGLPRECIGFSQTPLKARSKTEDSAKARNQISLMVMLYAVSLQCMMPRRVLFSQLVVLPIMNTGSTLIKWEMASITERKQPTTHSKKLGDVEPGTVVEPEQVTSMHHQRIFANAVILPTGETFVVGGQRQGQPFHDETWQPVPEIYSPENKNWTEVARHSTPRVYHSWAMLLPDATVVVGGGGLLIAETDHYDAQIYQPYYLFTPDGKTAVEQPKIKGTDKEVYKTGDKILVTTNVEVDAASLIRYSATTHTVNNDLRRIKLNVTIEGKASDKMYSVKIAESPSVALPGYWMLFVLQKNVPSHAATVQILAK
jgi:galactose oxidase